MVNKAIVVGRLGQDPELRYTSSGIAVCNFTVATSEKYKNKEGDPQETTEWHSISMWRKLAEIASQYLQKGSLVYLEGKLQTRSWEDNEGQKRYKTEIVASEMKMLSPRSENNAPPSSYPPEGAENNDEDDNDLPF